MTKRTGDRPSRGRASIATVAAEAGVSIATVSRIVNRVANKASPETAARVRAAIARLDYRPIGAGAALRQRRSRLVALLAANLANPSMAAIAAAAEAALREAGTIMVLCDTHDAPALQDEYLLEMRAQLAQAIVLLGAVPSPKLAAFRAAGEPLVFVNRHCPGDDAGPFVGIDNRAAGAAVAALLAERGIARGAAQVAAIHASMSSSATADRIAGFQAALAERGIALDPETLATEDSPDHLTIGYRAMARLLARKRRPRGVFCASDLIAYGAARAARERALAVPGDVLLVGFDDNPLNDWVAPWLTSVRVPYERYGAAIVEALRSIREGRPPPSIILPHVLVRRDEGGRGYA
jgi:LacI family transcriptional regulator